MNEQSKIVFSNRAYNSIVSETHDKIKTETGGILLGRIVNNVWYVIEVIDPGPNSIFTITYFEYDTPYVNHLAKTISKQYKIALEVLGLWHRHPGSMDTFSSTDDLTNTEFSRMSQKGVISGLVNLDPNFRITMYHVTLPLKYTKLSYAVGDNLFPNELLEQKYSFSESLNYEYNQKPDLESNPTRRRIDQRNNILNKFLDSIFKKPETKIVINNYLPIDNIVPITNKNDEDFLVDLYIFEELQLENILQVKYESEVKNDRIIYSVSKFKDGRHIESPILFDVNLDVRNPIFHCSVNEFKFSKGIFSRYVESKLNKKEFNG